jgi:NADH-quinone oxidoreductase subunit L
MWPLLVPGVLAFLLGLTIAFIVYYQRGGAPAKALAERFPALYRLVYDKWRIDELYDELVVGSLQSLAEASVWVDRWVVDGILARLTALLVTVWGQLLRLFQTGHTQAYAAVMVVGMFAVGWFVTMPQPKVVIAGDASTGQYTVEAAVGLGYSYRWDANGDGTYDTEEFVDTNRVMVSLEEGASRDVKLQVRNAFGRSRSNVFHVEREKRDASVPSARLPSGASERAALAQTSSRGNSP